MKIILNISHENLPVNFYSACSNHEQRYIARSEEEMFFHQIFISVKGGGNLLCQGKEYPITEGNAFYIARGVAYSHSSASTGMKSAFLTVCGDAMDLFSRHYTQNGFRFWESVNVEKWVDRIEKIALEYENNVNAATASAMAYSFFVDFFEEADKKLCTPAEKTKLFIEKHFSEHLTIDFLAKSMGVSPSKLCHDFKTAFGKTVFEFILDMRLEWAKNYLLANPHSLTKQAAQLSGFDDSSYFCRAFKKKYGHSPRHDGRING